MHPYFSIWWFPKLGVPLVIIHFSGILPYKPSIVGYPHDYGKPCKSLKNPLKNPIPYHFHRFIFGLSWTRRAPGSGRWHRGLRDAIDGLGTPGVVATEQVGKKIGYGDEDHR